MRLTTDTRILGGLLGLCLCAGSGVAVAAPIMLEPERRAIRAFSAARNHRGLLFRFAFPQLLIASGAGLCISFLPLYFKERFGDDWFANPQAGAFGGTFNQPR